MNNTPSHVKNFVATGSRGDGARAMAGGRYDRAVVATDSVAPGTTPSWKGSDT